MGHVYMRTGVTEWLLRGMAVGKGSVTCALLPFYSAEHECVQVGTAGHADECAALPDAAAVGDACRLQRADLRCADVCVSACTPGHACPRRRVSWVYMSQVFVTSLMSCVVYVASVQQQPLELYCKRSSLASWDVCCGTRVLTVCSHPCART